jgi:hypothetical protein
MPAPKKPSLEASRKAFAALKPLPKNYGMRVGDHFKDIDLKLLYRAVAGRVEYPAGLEALKVICVLYPAKNNQQLQSIAA